MTPALKKHLPNSLNPKNFSILAVFSKTLVAPKRDDSDEALIIAYKRGEKQAFDILLSRHHKPLYNFVLRFLGNHEAAEEAFQEIFLRVIRSAPDYQPTAKFTTWLYTIARNFLIDAARKNKLRRHASLSAVDDETGDSLENQIGDDSPGADVITRNVEIEVALTKILETLPEEQREVYLLRETQGLQFDEIARVTKASVNTVKSRMRYAIKGIAERLDEFGIDLI